MSVSSGSQPSEPTGGYLSAESKRRFTLLAGILGAVFFVAQFLLPILVMFLVMVPTVADHEFEHADLDHAAIVHGELWYVERTVKASWRRPEESVQTLSLARVRLEDLSEAGPAIPLEASALGPSPDLLAAEDRLWIVGPETVSYLENGQLTKLTGVNRPARSSRLFTYGGRPAVVSLGAAPMLVTLRIEGSGAEWEGQALPLGLDTDEDSLRAVQAVEANGTLYLFAQLCAGEPSRCSLRYREVAQTEWLPLAEDVCSCPSWTAIALGSRPAVILSEREGDRTNRLAILTVTANGAHREPIELEPSRRSWTDWHPLSANNRLLLVSEGMPGSLRSVEVVDGRVTRATRRPGNFPFGANMMFFMLIPQLLPVVLSLILAFLLTVEMRRHRIQDYALGEERRTFASLWQRALAQLVDILPIAAGFAAPFLATRRMFSDPERFMEDGTAFPLLLVGLVGLAFAWGLLVLAAYSYFEGRVGKTPGKWLFGIRVLGTDLRPCGFGRACLRNVLTFADGFFSFMVGALLVALTENWQRLGDLAARTIVVVDARPAR